MKMSDARVSKCVREAKPFQAKKTRQDIRKKKTKKESSQVESAYNKYNNVYMIIKSTDRETRHIYHTT